MDRRTSISFELSVDGEVATVWYRSGDKEKNVPGGKTGAMALANLFDDLRADDSIRVIVLHRGGANHAGNPTEHYLDNDFIHRHNDPANIWRTFSGIVRMHEAMAGIEKPIVCQVDGDLIGGGSNVALACDIIVARDDARFLDHHLAMGQAAPLGPPYGLVPGDGGLALLPLYLSPPLAKEFLMLGRGFTARELADLGVINYAVPAAELDGLVGDIVRRLLLRPAYPLAWTKRVANRHVLEQLNRTLDAAAAYEALGLSQYERNGFVDRLALD